MLMNTYQQQDALALQVTTTLCCTFALSGQQKACGGCFIVWSLFRGLTVLEHCLRCCPLLSRMPMSSFLCRLGLFMLDSSVFWRSLVAVMVPTLGAYGSPERRMLSHLKLSFAAWRQPSL